MTDHVQATKWTISASFLLAGVIGAGAVLVSPAAAQTAGAPEPGCTMANMTPSSNATNGTAGAAAFACVADLDGNGTSEMVVGAIYDISGQGGYLLYITNNGVIRKKVCWGSGGCPSSPPRSAAE